MRVQLEQVERSVGHHDERLDSVKIPQGFEYLFEIYLKLRRGQALTYNDLVSYQSITGKVFDAFEVDALFAMDSAMEAFLEERMKNNGA